MFFLNVHYVKNKRIVKYVLNHVMLMKSYASYLVYDYRIYYRIYYRKRLAYTIRYV